jgi:hypothetical protein
MMDYNDRFTDSVVHADREMWRCMTCGAVVENREAHDDWHETLEARLHELWMRPTVAVEDGE